VDYAARLKVAIIFNFSNTLFCPNLLALKPDKPTTNMIGATGGC